MSSSSLLTIAGFVLVSCFSTVTSSSYQPSFLQCLREHSNPSTSIDSAIYTSDNSSFLDLLTVRSKNKRFLTPGTRKPHAIITALHESHIQSVVLCSKNHGLQLRIRSGGHDYEGLSYRSQVPFVILDMFHLNAIDIDVENQTAMVQAGATMGQIYYAVSKKTQTLAFPGGVGITVGAGGLILGGGYGNLIRKYGLSADNVMDAQIVDANGKIHDRRSMGEDVFWAIRGSGGTSYGVILSWTVKLVPVPPKVTVFNINKTMEEGATDIVYKWQHIAPQLPEELFIRMMLVVVNGSEEGTKTVSTHFIGQFLGLSHELIPLLDERFPELGLKETDCHEVSLSESAIFWADFPLGTPPEILLTKPKAPQVFMKSRSDYVRNPISKQAIDSIWDFMIQARNGWMQWNPFGGRMSEISESETPYPHRQGVLFLIQNTFFWHEEDEQVLQHYMNISRSWYHFMEPHVSKSPREAYLNYRDLEIGANPSDKTIPIIAKVYGAKYFKDNFERLVQGKRRFDPENFFRNEQSIPLSVI